MSVPRWHAPLGRALRSRAIHWCVPLVSGLLAAGAIGPHFVFDDHVLALAARGQPAIAGLARNSWDLFTFTTGDPSRNRELVDHGFMLPWWSDDTLKIAFFRPLSSLYHRLDYLSWPDSAQLMALHSLAWLMLTVALVACLYRALEVQRPLAAVASICYGLDDARGAVVGWISNRNALIATAFGALAMLAHYRWRGAAHQPSAWIGPACFFLALAAGELGLGTFAYVLAYAVFLDSSTPQRRVFSVLPYGAVLVVWSVIYVHSGASVQASGTYISPLEDPARFLAVAPERFAALLAATLGPLPADVCLMLGHDRFAGWATLVGIVVLGALAALVPLLRRDRIARFWVLGMVLSIAPVMATFPSDRLLMFASIGGMGLVARLVAPPLSGRPIAWTAKWVGLAFAIVHVGVAPCLLPARAAQMQLIGRTMASATALLDALPDLDQRTVVIVNAPVDLLASYIQAERAARGALRPKRLYWLTSAGTPVRVQRADAHTLRVEREGGFLSMPLEQHYRCRPSSLAQGATVTLSAMTARVAEVTGQGRPRVVDFRFREPLDAHTYAFFVWRDGRYEPLAPERLTRPLTLRAENLAEILVRALKGASR